MSRDALYPVDSSSYTSWDGKTYDVPCTIAGAAAFENDPVYSCPGGFVPPRDDSDPRNCIKVISSPDSIFFQIYLCLMLARPFYFPVFAIIVTAVSRQCVYDRRVYCYVARHGDRIYYRTHP